MGIFRAICLNSPYQAFQSPVSPPSPFTNLVPDAGTAPQFPIFSPPNPGLSGDGFAYSNYLYGGAPQFGPPFGGSFGGDPFGAPFGSPFGIPDFNQSFPVQEAPTTGTTPVTSTPVTGSTSQNSTVALLEVYPDDPFSGFKKDGHDEAVKQTLNQFAPEANTQTYSFYNSTTSPANTAESPISSLTEANQLIDSSGYDSLHTASQKVQQIMQNDPSTDVINMSLSLSKKDIYQSVMDAAINNNDSAKGIALGKQMGLSETDLKAYYNDPQFADPATRKNIQSTAKTNIENGIAAYVDKRMSTATGGQTFQTGLAEWQQATQNLANQNVAVVVAAGNNHNTPGFANAAPNGAELNLMAMSNNVISVAASTNNSSSGMPANFSSQGGGGFNPTLSADGTDIRVTLDGRNTEVDGTSFSTPTVSAIIAQLKERNPNLSFAQIKSILTSTAFNTSAPASLEGAGILNVNGALGAVPSA